jgi:hypothetical protein
MIRDWHAIARTSLHLLRKHRLLLLRLEDRRKVFAISQLRRYSIMAICAKSEKRAAAAASAVKCHAEHTVAGLMQQLEAAQEELDEIRKDEMVAMAAYAEEVNSQYDDHQKQQQQQQLFISSSLASTDSWGSTADFVRAKLTAMTVRTSYISHTSHTSPTSPASNTHRVSSSSRMR